MPSGAPYKLQPHSSSYQDSVNVPSRQHVHGSSNGVDARQGSSCAGQGGLSSLECVDHCHPLLLQDVPGEGGRQTFSSWWKVPCYGLVFVVIDGDAHLSVEVRHDVGRQTSNSLLIQRKRTETMTQHRIAWDQNSSPWNTMSVTNAVVVRLMARGGSEREISPSRSQVYFLPA